MARTAPADIWDLFDFGSISKESDLTSFLAKVLDHSVDWFQAFRGTIFLSEPDDPIHFRLAAVRGKADIPPGTVIALGKGIAGAAIELGMAIVVDDPGRNPLLSERMADRPRENRSEIRSSMVIPLQAAGIGVVGVLNLARSDDQPSFNQEDLARANQLANNLGLAVGNARLFSQLRNAIRDAETSKEILNTVVEHLGVQIVLLEKGRVIQANPSAVEMFGPAVGELSDYLASAPAALRKAILEASQKPHESHRVQVADDQSDRAWSILWSKNAIGSNLLAIEEVTAFHKATKQANRHKRLAEIGQMSAAIAHEIRNPLTGIRSAAQMITAAPEQSGEFAKIIEHEVMKLNTLCEEFLDFSRPFQLRVRYCSLLEVAHNVVTQEQASFDMAGVQLRVGADGEDLRLPLDSHRMEQVIRNLLRNAREATVAGKRVTIYVKPDGFSVMDEGSGMTMDAQDKLFTPFFTTKPNGTGLGLSNVRKIVEAHSGAIRVSSQLGKGTRVDVSLPFKSEEEFENWLLENAA